ncbi:hypothetical protein Tco_0187955, partial [Tanacetum coccineum]
GHNTNDYYHLKKQIEEAVASGRLAHLVKDIRQSGQKGKGSAKGKEKVITMVRSQGYRKRPYEKASGSEGYMLMVVALQRLCTSIASEILATDKVEAERISNTTGGVLRRSQLPHGGYRFGGHYEGVRENPNNHNGIYGGQESIPV